MRGLIPKANEDRARWGIGLMLCAYLFFSCIDTGVKWLGLFGFPALQLAFMRYIGHFVISLGRILNNGLSIQHFYTPRPGLVMLRGVLILLGTLANFFSLKYLPLTLTSTILFSAPILVCLFSGPVLGERVGKWRWSAIVLGFIGILVAIRPFDDGFHPAALLSLFGALCFSGYLLITRLLAGVVAADSMQFYVGAIGSFVLLPFAIADWQAPTTTVQWFVLISLGCSAWVGHEMLTRAHGYADASVLTPFAYSFILYLGIWSALLFNQYPDNWTATGATIIVCSGLVIWYRERQLRHKPQP
jgi:drug/metabolite transporter (DMT)-like permease